MAIDEKVLNAVYHEGLKAFYSGNYRQSIQTLTQAIEGGSANPACYYFRGLAESRLGNGPAAQQDFTKGAELEGRDFSVFYNASQALERIQGPERRTLETYRVAGRKSALAAVEKIRLEQFHRFDPSQAAPAAPADATLSTPADAAPAAAPSPFDTPQPSMPAGGAQPAAPSSDPFGAPAAPGAAQPAQPGASPPAQPSPGGFSPFVPTTPPPAAQPPAAPAPGGNPFGS
ncbi:MAG: hypothetical protein QM775_08180 [Pirellulales bacterium]